MSSGDVHADLASALEAVLFAADRPLSANELADIVKAVEEVDVDPGRITEVLDALRVRYAEDLRGFDLMQVAGGWEFRTRSAYADYVHVLYKRKPQKLSRAALEVLAIVAYRQPVTRPEVDDIRGVDSSNTLRQLLERNLLRILGKADEVGRPLIYGTSQDFLGFFGMQSLAELPTLREFTELTEEHVVRLQTLDATLGANTQGVLAAALPGAVTPPGPNPTAPTESGAQPASDPTVSSVSPRDPVPDSTP